MLCRLSTYKESLSNIALLQDLIREEECEIQEIRREQYELEEKVAALKAKAGSLSKRKRAKVIDSNNRLLNNLNFANAEEDPRARLAEEID